MLQLEGSVFMEWITIGFVTEIISFIAPILLFILILCIDAKIKMMEKDMEITASKCIDFQMQLHKLNEQAELTNLYLKKLVNQCEMANLQKNSENEEKKVL